MPERIKPTTPNPSFQRTAFGSRRTQTLANMEPTLLFIVEDAFQITGRGCILVPGPSAEAGGPTLRVGDLIRLVKPDGEIVDTDVRGIEMINRRPRPQMITAPILLPKAITKEQVSVGTRVLSLREQVLANPSIERTSKGWPPLMSNVRFPRSTQ